MDTTCTWWFFLFFLTGGRQGGRSSWSQSVGGAGHRTSDIRFRTTARNELPRRGRHHHELHRSLHSAVRAGPSHSRQKLAASQRRRRCGKSNRRILLYICISYRAEVSFSSKDTKRKKWWIGLFNYTPCSCSHILYRDFKNSTCTRHAIVYLWKYHNYYGWLYVMRCLPYFLPFY